ncbi:MAG: hypothetical protein KDK23_05695 [Leptospiraceae bacterium]|nr:hypothetical protein [Leptospiraceae bacterium]
MALVIALLFQSALAAEDTRTADPGPEPDARPSESETEAAKSQEATTILPQPKPALIGFHKDRMTVTLAAGPSVSAPAGSLISHEKSYDTYLQYQVQTGQITTDILGQQARFYNPAYEAGPVLLWDLEAALSDHFGAGAGLLFSSISTNRMDVLPWRDSAGNQVLDYPDNRIMYSEGALMGFLTYHPLNQSRFDPYIKLRAGITFAHGYAHQYTFPDPYLFEKDMNNARGAIYGASVGLNAYVTPVFAFSLEYTGIRRSLSADQFGSRTLSSGYLTLGFTFGLDAR